MGWMILFAIGPLYRALTLPGFLLLLIGGLFYTFGIIFFILDEKMKHSHGIWHMFVLGGSVTQYLCLLLYVAN
jgi:hemolysin III